MSDLDERNLVGMITNQPNVLSWQTGSMDRLFVNRAPANSPELWSPGGTGIHRAIVGGRLHQVRLLISMKANVDKRDSAGCSPLMMSAIITPEEHGVRCIKVLLRAGADVNMLDFMGRSALGLASMHGMTRAVEVLLQEDKLEKNLPDKNGDTPLNLAASLGFTDIVSVLVTALVKDGIPVDHRNHQGCTALLLATKMGHYDCARILLENGKASVNSRDNDCFMNCTEWAKFSQQKLANEIRSRSALLIDDPRMRASEPRPESSPPPSTAGSSRAARRFIPPFHSFSKEIQMIGQLRQRHEELSELIVSFQERERDRSEAGSRCGNRRKDSRVSSATSASTERLDPSFESTRSTVNTPLDLGILFRMYTEQQRTRPSQPVNRTPRDSVPSLTEPPSLERHGSATGKPPPIRRHQSSMLTGNPVASNSKRRTTLATLA